MYNKILVPLDGSELAECVLPHVETIAKGCGVATVTFLRVVEPFYMPAGGEGYTVSEKQIAQIEAEGKKEAKEYLGQLLRRLEYSTAKVKTEVIKGHAAESIADYATKNQFDLVVIATHGRSGVSRWVWGSVADRILRSVCIPVLMVRAPGCMPGI
ncbi:MAG: universal stress protein [Dehalococcoidales bacterium]|nr:universal stress protein [Dehalococcoidales bacterium]